MNDETTSRMRVVVAARGFEAKRCAITPIKLGDVVFCADFDQEQRTACWVNGMTVAELFESLPTRQGLIFSSRARMIDQDDEERSHRTFYLRHRGERYRQPGEDLDLLYVEDREHPLP